jgi:hypothetical protein
MAIEMQCPACKKGYRLKDELAGKRVTCANPACRTAFVVPAKPGTGTAPTLAAMKSAAAAKAKSAVEVETAALTALRDEPDEEPVESRVIPVKCDNCDHQWTEPWDKQGKNVLCPECRTRQRVPIPDTKKGKTDWRKDGMPAGRKIEKLEGVVASTEAGYVAGESLRAAGLGQPELEPRSLWQKVALVAGPILALFLLVVGVVSFRQFRAESKQSATMDLALADLPPDDSPLAKGEIPLFRAAIHVAAGEYTTRKPEKTDKKLAEALTQFGIARQQLEAQPSSFGRDMLFGALASAQVGLGGTDAEVDAGQRIRYVPAASGRARARINERPRDVQGELRQTFTAMTHRDRAASLEARLDILRRVTRELGRAGQADIVEPLVPVLFQDAEQVEATAVALYEAARAGGDPKKLTPAVEALVPAAAAGRPPQLVALAQTLDPVPPPFKVTPYQPGTGPLDDNPRTTYALLALLRNNPAEAIEVARRPGRTDSRLRTLAHIAELSTEPAVAVTAAAEVYEADGKKRQFGEVSDAIFVRLARQAGRANLPERADLFAKACGRDDTRAWARAEAIRGQAETGAPKAVPESAVELPADPREARVGTAWARLWVARASAAAGDARPAAAFDGWGKGTFRPFGLAGQALGLQDRELHP